MAIRPKSKELLQAQLVSYARDAVSDHRDRKHLLLNADQLSEVEVVDGVRYTTEPVNSILDSSEIHPAYDRTAGNKDDYANYLRRTRGGRDVDASEREDLLRNFASYESSVLTLTSDIDELGLKRGDHPSFLGQGLNMMAFTLTHDDRDVVARIPTQDNRNPGDVDERARAAILARDILGMERIIAISYETGVVISEFMPGKGLEKLTGEELGAITQEQLEQFVHTCALAAEKGLLVDPKPSNIFYDKVKGFGVIDYQFDTKKGAYDPMDVAVYAFTEAGKSSAPRSLEDIDEIINTAEAKIKILNMLSSMIDVTQGDNRDNQPARIKEAIKDLEYLIKKYSDKTRANAEILATKELDEYLDKVGITGPGNSQVHIDSDVL